MGALRAATPLLLLFQGLSQQFCSSLAISTCGEGQMLFLIPALAEWKVENAVCSSISSLIAATKTKVGNYDNKKNKKKNRIFMFSLDDKRLIAASHNSSPSRTFPKSNTKCRFCVRLIKRDLRLCLGVCFCACVSNIKPSGRPTGSWREQVSLAGFICRKGKDDVLSRISGGPWASRAHGGRGPSASGASSTPTGDLHAPTHPYMKSEMKLLSHARLSINTLATVGVNALCASTKVSCAELENSVLWGPLGLCGDKWGKFMCHRRWYMDRPTVNVITGFVFALIKKQSESCGARWVC